MGFAHEYHHEKDGVGLDAGGGLPPVALLLRCLRATRVPCQDNAKAAQRTVRAWIEESAARAVPAARWPDFAQRGADMFRDHPEVEAYVLWRFEPVTSLVAEIRAAADPASRIEVIDINDGWRSGSDLAALARICDGILLCAYDRAPAAVRAAAAAVQTMLPAQCRLGVGMRLFYPEMKAASDIVERTQAAIHAGASEMHYYNYAWWPAARLDWVRAAVDAARGMSTAPQNPPGRETEAAELPARDPEIQNAGPEWR